MAQTVFSECSGSSTNNTSFSFSHTHKILLPMSSRKSPGLLECQACTLPLKPQPCAHPCFILTAPIPGLSVPRVSPTPLVKPASAGGCSTGLFQKDQGLIGRCPISGPSYKSGASLSVSPLPELCGLSLSSYFSVQFPEHSHRGDWWGHELKSYLGTVGNAIA